ncbi:proline racemase family protein [Salicibibacter cibarius]|uniref:Proline racemase family protein n=1 Tax=Salicibibacter cibarius TaxID=2743000 RepID=A0A7T6Z6D7_9BACI|nr:proline racemase family protein [Salicibibacter cibarius]QQK77724.1 proline racemase family protein [Salicibibacter cibarius]
MTWRRIGIKVNKLVHTIDAHAEGELSRVVVGGVVDIPGETMFDKKMYLENYNDEFRKFLIHELRGSTVLHADLVLPSTNSMADAGFSIMEATDSPPMSGSNTICT